MQFLEFLYANIVDSFNQKVSYGAFECPLLILQMIMWVIGGVLIYLAIKKLPHFIAAGMYDSYTTTHNCKPYIPARGGRNVLFQLFIFMVSMNIIISWFFRRQIYDYINVSILLWWKIFVLSFIFANVLIKWIVLW